MFDVTPRTFECIIYLSMLQCQCWFSRSCSAGIAQSFHWTNLNLGLQAAWWRHQMETFLCCWPFARGIYRSPFDSRHKGPVAHLRNFLWCKHKKLSIKRRNSRWSETPLSSCDVTVMGRFGGIWRKDVMSVSLVWPWLNLDKMNANFIGTIFCRRHYYKYNSFAENVGSSSQMSWNIFIPSDQNSTSHFPNQWQPSHWGMHISVTGPKRVNIPQIYAFDLQN